MMMNESLSTVELKLAESVPFGSYEYISEGLLSVYVALLTSMANEYPAVRGFLKALSLVDEKSRRLVFRDPLLRRTVEDGVCQVLKGLNTIEPAMFDELLTAAESGLTTNQSLLNESRGCVPFNRSFGYGYVWVDDQSDSLPGRRFRNEFLRRLPGFHVDIPTPTQIESLTDAVSQANKISPILSRSAFSHNFMVVIGEFKNGIHVNSLTMPGLPGVIFLSPQVFSSSVRLSEALFHEAFHLKFLDIDYIHPLFAIGFRPERSPLVTPIWHSEKPQNGNWPIDRVLTSMHVYVALAIFHAKADGDDEMSTEDRAARASQCKSRAAWLFDTAQTYQEFLSDAGKEFVASMGEMLTELDATIPSKNRDHSDFTVEQHNLQA